MNVLVTEDGLKLHLQRWPCSGPSHGTVQIVHGLGEHIGRYAVLAQALNAAGWHVVGHDQRGHGRSEGRRGVIAHGNSLLTDLSAVMDHLRDPRRHVLLGHSMGGLVAARFVSETLSGSARRWAREVDGLVLSSPALDPGLGPLQRALLALLGPVAPNLRVGNGLKPAWISRDPEVVAAYRHDELVHSRVTPRLVRFIVDEAQRVQGRAGRWRTPTLLLWAGADRCVRPAGSRAFAAAAPHEVLTGHELPGCFHEIFNEPEAERVRAIAHVTQWLRRFHQEQRRAA